MLLSAAFTLQAFIRDIFTGPPARHAPAAPINPHLWNTRRCVSKLLNAGVMNYEERMHMRLFWLGQTHCTGLTHLTLALAKNEDMPVRPAWSVFAARSPSDRLRTDKTAMPKEKECLNS